MQITLEINNPHYVAGIEDMAQSAGVDVQTLAAALVENQINSYTRSVQNEKRRCVMQRLPERLAQNLKADNYNKEELL